MQAVLESIDALLGAGANVDAEDQEGRTSLMIACEKGYIQIVDKLIQCDARVYMKDRMDKTPLFYAIEAPAENSDVVVRLIKEGANIDSATVYNCTPLLRATQKQYHQILPLLIENKANVNARLSSKNNNKTALHIACE